MSRPSYQSPRVAILGAGLSGLSVAWFLQKKGLAPFIFESSHQAGGVIKTEQTEGFQFEYGPNSLLIHCTEMAELIQDLGLEHEIVEANPQAKKRFIVRHGKPIPVPLSPFQFLSTPLLSPWGKLRLLTEPFRSRSRHTQESLASFVQRRLGQEALDYLLNPFVSGVYAGSPEKLSARHAFPTLWNLEQNNGSLTRGLLLKKRHSSSSTTVPRRLISFRMGMQTLTNALAQNLEPHLHLNTPVHRVEKTATHWLVNGQPFDKVISTLPWTQPFSLPPQVEKPTTEIPYSPVDIWHLGFKRNQIDHALDGFGLLVPELEKKNILGCLFPTTLFPNRAPSDQILLSVFVGGFRQPALTHLSDSASLDLVLTDLNELLGLHGLPQWKKRISWPRAIPQYNQEHDAFLESLAQIENNYPGWFFAGNYREGVSLSDCILRGKKMAQKMGATT
jgi:protoporphyrinogen/coproporphyrinogen III oxidase